MRATAAALAICVCGSALADFGDYVAHDIGGQSLTVTTSRGTVRLTAVDDGAIYVHYVEEGVKQLPSFALDTQTDAVTTAVHVNEQAIEFGTDLLTARVLKQPTRLEFLRNGEPLVEEEYGYFATETLRGFRFRLEDEEKILGGGQRVLGMDRRGHRLPLYNKAHYGYTTQSEQMYYGLPAIMSTDRYAIAFDNSATGHLDIGKTESDVLQFEAVAGRTAYLIVTGESYPALIENLTDATGKQPLPPRWALGNFASRFGYRSEKQTRDVVRRFQKARIPLDAVILDLYWFGPDIQGHMGNLDWDRTAFPNPEDMIADFRKAGVKTITITEPFVLRSSTQWDSAVEAGALATGVNGKPRRFDFYFGNTGLIDVFHEPARDWFSRYYNRLYDQGIAGNWGDLGEPEVHPADTQHSLGQTIASADEVHNAYGHRWAQMVYENQREAMPDSRPVVMMRAGFVGSQRYGMIPWTGDVDRSWGGLKPQVELSLQMGVFGLAYTHSDLGGFAGGETFDAEMYTRWLQYGVFQPVYRPHAQEHIPPEPVFHDRTTQRRVRDAIELRYRLLPYHYTMAFENSTTGMPLMRPVFFEDEDNPDLVDIRDTYLWGDAFLVKPVTEPGVSNVEVDLPAGVWFDFYSGDRHVGGQTVSAPVTLETLPVFVRAGSFVPMAELVQSTDDYSSEHLELHYYADTTVDASTGQLFEDDGESFGTIERGDYERLAFSARRDNNGLLFFLSRTHGYDGQPASRTIDLVVHNLDAAPNSISVGDDTMTLRRKLPRRGAGAVWDAKSLTLTVRIPWDHSDTAISLQ